MKGNDERFVHRIEAFSDIVIGFSLAQLGATLVIPPHAQALVDNPGWMVGFLWTFALVCLMWWNHHRMFRTFKMTPASVILNFVLLATIVLVVYFAQVFARVTTIHDAIVASRLYFGALGTSAVVSAFLFYVNVGVVRGTMVNAVSGLLQLAIVAASFSGGDQPIEVPIMGIAVPIAWMVGGFAARRVRSVDLDATPV
jgi:hypothetical protein